MGAQTYRRVEHIVVDGGSEDGTLGLLRKSPGVRWISEGDSGQSEAINKGFRMAEGSILTWLNADDTLTSTAVELAVEAFSQDADVGWVYGKCEMLDGDKIVLLEPPAILTITSFDLGNIVPQPGTFIAAWALERVGYLDETFHLSMDFDLWLRLVDGRIRSTYVPETLAVFEVHPGSKTGTVGTADFFVEEFRALLKIGRGHEAAMTLGRASARAALQGEKISRRRLVAEVDRFAAMGKELDSSISLRTVRSAARTEAAALEIQDSILGLRHLMAPSPWLTKHSRRSAFLVAKTAAARILQRSVR